MLRKITEYLQAMVKLKRFRLNYCKKIVNLNMYFMLLKEKKKRNNSQGKELGVRYALTGTEDGFSTSYHQ